jgi:hypothetical protein
MNNKPNAVFVVLLTTQAMEVHSTVHATRNGALRYAERACKEEEFYDVRITERTIQGGMDWTDLK